MTPRLILIAGTSGSGKSTICEKLVAALGEDRCLQLSLDSYYYDFSYVADPTERAAINFDDPINVELELVERHLADLSKGLTVDVPVYDFATHSRTRAKNTISAAGKDYIVAEGIFGLLKAIQHLADVKVYVETDRALAFERRKQRDVKERGRTPESVTEQYNATVLPMQILHVEPCKAFADVVIINNSHNFGINVAPIINHIAGLETVQSQAAVAANDINLIEGLGVLQQGAAFTASVAGLFANVKSLALQKIEDLDTAARDYFAPEAQKPENKF